MIGIAHRYTLIFFLFIFALMPVSQAFGETEFHSLPPKTKGHCYFPHSVHCDPKGMPLEPAPAAFSGDGWDTQSIGYNIFIEKHFPKKVYSGQPYQYTIDVTNLSDIPLENVNIIERFPESFKVTSTDPSIYDSKGDKVAWALGQLNPKETRTITVNGIASTNGQVPCCTEANFKHPDLCLSTDVVDPGLKLAVNGPQEVLRCDNIPLEYVVQNSGESTLNDIQINQNLPGVMSSAEPGKYSSLQVGDLGSGKETTVRTVIPALPAGDYTFSGLAEGMPARLFEGGTPVNPVTANSGTVNVKVLNPALKVTASTSRNNQVIGRAIDYSFEVTNTGNGNAASSELRASIPDRTSFKSASDQGSHSMGSVTWDLGNIAPGATRKVSMTVVAKAAGTASTNVQADAVCVDVATASTGIPVKGVPALLLEAIDSRDPLEIGQATEYEIRVTNQGNGPATNIKLTGAFEDMNYISSKGHTPIENSGKNLSFGAFDLAPKETVIWKIQLEAAKVGDQRFKIIMNSDQLTRPVEETESTTIY